MEVGSGKAPNHDLTSVGILLLAYVKKWSEGVKYTTEK